MVPEPSDARAPAKADSDKSALPTTDSMPREEFLSAVALLAPTVDLDLVARAHDFGLVAHEGQVRKSGEPYFSHALAVALSLAEWHQDSVTIGAGLIHDVVEDTISTTDDIEREFGEQMATIVDGVTKISAKVFFSNPDSQEVKQSENFRKMLVAMAKDIRVILVKFADRRHNMQTLQHLDPAKQRRIALETRDIYAPLAHRLGMAKVKWELEDLSMKYLEPEAYRMLASRVASRRTEREALLDSIRVPLEERIRTAKIDVTIIGRPKHFYSIHKKMERRNKQLEEIYDLLAIRVITDTIENCYHILGIVHSLWKPLPDRFKDYIATPKSNMYQSLHTTVSGPTGDLVEIQIRTEVMDQTAEEGIAAHWVYKEQSPESDSDGQFRWLRQVMEWQRDLSDPHEFMEDLKIDLFQDECFVFTPKGDLLRLPQGATPVDFAFLVHTEVGLRCAGAKVNGRYVTLSTPLKNGDSVEIVTSNHQTPSRDWLSFAKTGKARSKIRQVLRKKMRAESIVLGREIFEREVRKRRLTIRYNREFEEVLKGLGVESVDDLFADIANGEVSPAYVLNRIAPPPAPPPRIPAVIDRIVDRARGNMGIRVEGVDNVMTRLAECCQPVPGDSVFGYITRGRGITIHRVDCPNSFSLDDSERRIGVQWAPRDDESFVVDVTVVANDRSNLLHDLTSAISNMDINLRGTSATSSDGCAEMHFVMEVANLKQLNKMLKDLERVKGIEKVYRRSSALDGS